MLAYWKKFYSYMGPFGVFVCLLGGSVMIYPMYRVIQENIRMLPVVNYSNKIRNAGVKIQYEPCEGDRENVRKTSPKGDVETVTICTQKSRKKIGEVDYLMRVLRESSGIPID